MKDAYIYPYEPYQSSCMYPQAEHSSYPVHEVSCNGFYKRITTKPPNQMAKSQKGRCMQQGIQNQGECVLQDPAILESSTYSKK